MRFSKKKAVVLAAMLFVANSFAGVGIQAEVGALSLSDIMFSMISNSSPDDLGSKIGVRVSGNSPVAFDFLLGFGSRSEVPSIDSINQYGDPKYFSLGTTLGLSMKVHTGEKSALSIMPRYTFTVVSNGVDTASNFGQDSKFLYYSSLFHRLSLSIEPSVKLSENMELFTNYGISIKFIPNSKYYSINKWKDAKDGAVFTGFSGILLGFRYNL